MKHRVLFVDDESNILDAMRNVLRKEPFEFVGASSGEAGLALLERQHIDVVVSDERMAGMSGSQFLAHVRRRFPHTVRIVLTGQADVDAAIRAINEGEVFRFLVKPCAPADLACTIRQALQLRDLARGSSRLLKRARRQQLVLDKLEDEHPGITSVTTDASGAIVIDVEEVGIDDLVDQLRQACEQDGE
jgi:two-component system probable response regulator PhcQ